MHIGQGRRGGPLLSVGRTEGKKATSHRGGGGGEGCKAEKEREGQGGVGKKSSCYVTKVDILPLPTEGSRE